MSDTITSNNATSDTNATSNPIFNVNEADMAMK